MKNVALIDPHVDEFLNTYGIYIAIGFVALILICIVLIFIISHLKKKQKSDKKVSKNELFAALGNNENIDSFDIKGSRLTIFFKNKELLDIEKIKLLGFDNYILLSNKITFTLNENNKKYIQDLIKED